MNIDAYDFYLTELEFMEIYQKLKEKGVDQKLLNKLMSQIDWMDQMLLWNGICPNCGHDIEKKLKFYEDSGTEVQYICEYCKEEYEGNDIGF